MPKTDYPLLYEFHLGLDDLNKQLEEYVQREVQKASTLQEDHSNYGGWHSDRNLDLHLDDGSKRSGLLIPLFLALSDAMKTYIRECHTKFKVEVKPEYDWNYTGAWFNVAFPKSGNYNSPHVHAQSNNQISGAYYIQTETPSSEHPLSGRIDFIDKQNKSQYGFFPKPGTLFLFPSDLLHWVHPYYGDKIRICFSFNVKGVI